jgi:hypothetical protein
MTRTTTLATAIRRKEWERAALLLLIGLLEAARNAPPGTIDDVLAMLGTDDRQQTTDNRADAADPSVVRGNQRWRGTPDGERR